MEQAAARQGLVKTLRPQHRMVRLLGLLGVVDTQKPLVAVRQADLSSATYIAANIREQDKREIRAVYQYRDNLELAAYCLTASPNCAYVAELKGEPVAIYGMTQPLPHIAVGWAYGTDKFRRVAPALTRHILDVGIPKMFARGVHRIEVRSIMDHDISHRWLANGLGGAFEGICKGYGRNREDFALYALVKD